MTPTQQPPGLLHKHDDLCAMLRDAAEQVDPADPVPGLRMLDGLVTRALARLVPAPRYRPHDGDPAAWVRDVPDGGGT